jgi:hypothetical protein
MSVVRRLIFLTATIALGASSTVPVQRPADWRRPAGADWPLAGGDWLNSRYTTLRQITPANVTGLRGAWVTELRPDSSRAAPLSKTASFSYLPPSPDRSRRENRRGPLAISNRSQYLLPAGSGNWRRTRLLGPRRTGRCGQVDQGGSCVTYTPQDTPRQAITAPPVTSAVGCCWACLRAIVISADAWSVSMRRPAGSCGALWSSQIPANRT